MKPTREHFKSLLPELAVINSLAVLTDHETLHTAANCELTARQMAQESSDERFNRVGEAAWNAVYTMLAYIKAKTQDNDESEEVATAAEALLMMMDASTAGPVLFY